MRDREAWHAAVHGAKELHGLVTEQQQHIYIYEIHIYIHIYMKGVLWVHTYTYTMEYCSLILLNITNHQADANQYYNEVSPRACQNGCYQKDNK